MKRKKRKEMDSGLQVQCELTCRTMSSMCIIVQSYIYCVSLIDSVHVDSSCT